MLEQGYEPKLACGAVAISGTLAMLIPPSIALILYGLIADLSIGKLLVAGIIPGILVMLTIALTIFLLAILHPEHAPPAGRYTLAEKFASLRVVGPMALLIMMVTGIIYLGVATPTEAAALGAFGAMVLAVAQRKLSWETLGQALWRAASTTAMVMFIILGATIFGYFITITQLTREIVTWVGDLDVPRLVILLMVLAGYFVLACFLDQVAILILTVPIVLPMMTSLGYDPIWFGVLIIVLAEVGLVTPPVGLNVFVVSRYTWPAPPAARITERA